MIFYFLNSFIYLICLFIFCFHSESWAQISADQIQRDTLQRLQSNEKKKREENIKSELIRNRKKNQKKKAITDVGPQFLVKRIVVGKSRLLRPEEIAKITKKYEGKYLSVAELQYIIQDINQLYAEKKGALSRAVLPPQKIKNGIVKIILIESKLGKVIFENTQYTSQDYLRWVLVLDRQDDLNFRDIENIFIRFNKNHQSMKVYSQLQPGENFGETDILIKIKESKRWAGEVLWDNEGSQSTGTNRYGLNLQSISLFGFDDQAVLGGTKSEGQKSGFLSYDFPFSPFGTRAKILYSYSTQNIVEGGFSDLNIKGSASFFSARVMQNIITKRALKWNSSLELVISDNKSTLGGFELENSHFKYSPGTSLNIYDSKGAWVADISFHQSLRRGSTDSVPFERTWYSKIPWSLSRHYILNPRLTFLGRLSGQKALSNELPPSEQFTLGGLNNRAFYTAEFSADKGYALELRAEYSGALEKYIPSSFNFVQEKIFLALQRGSAKTVSSEGREITNSGAVTSLSCGLKARISSYFHGEIIFPIALSGGKDRNKRSLIFSLRGQF